MSEAQDNWQKSSLYALTESVPNVNPSDQPAELYTYVDISAVDNENHIIASPNSVLGRDAPSRARLPIQNGDVLFSNVRPYLRNVAQVIDILQPAVASTGFTLLRAKPNVSSRFLFHLVRSRYFLSLVAGSESGTHYPATSATKVRSIEVFVPPLATQTAVASLLDSVQETRKHVLAELAKAHADIVGAVRSATLLAISGTLTEAWRETHGLDMPSATIPSDIQDGSNLPGLSIYPTVRLKDCIENTRLGTRQRSQPDESGLPVLRMGNIQDGELDWSDLRYLPRESVDQSLILKDGDVLFNRSNSPELVGKTAVFRGTRAAIYADYLICIKVKRGVLHPDWLCIWLNSPLGRQWAAGVRTAGANQANINSMKLIGLELPLPVYDEQEEIVRRLRLIETAAKQAMARVDAAAREVRGTVEILLDQAVSGPADRPFMGGTMGQPSARDDGASSAPYRQLDDIPWTDVPKKHKGTTSGGSIAETGHLAGIVAAAGGRLAVGELWRRSVFNEDIDFFYAELRRAINSGILTETRDRSDFAAIELRP